MNKLGGGRSFVKKLRKGNVVLTNREVYLRDDLVCGHPLCKECLSSSTADTKDQFTLDAKADLVLLVDTNLVLHQLDVLEDAAIRNVVVLETVLDEVKHRSGAAAARLSRLLADARERAWAVFCNEHHRATHTERTAGESANDRNDRAIRAAAAWFAAHLPRPVRVRLLTDDQGSREAAQAAGLDAMGLRPHLESLGAPGRPLLDKLSAPADADNLEALPAARPYPEHLSGRSLDEAIRSGSLLQGVLRVSRDNIYEAYVPRPGTGQPDVLVAGRAAMNRALDGDVVALELLPEAQWRAAPAALLDDDQAAELVREAELDEPPPAPGGARLPTGRVVAIVRRVAKPLVGLLHEPEQAEPPQPGGAVLALFRCTDRRVPRVRLRTNQLELLRGQLVVAAIDGWARTSRYPHGHIVRSLGPVGDKMVETDALLIQYEVPFHSFSNSVRACLPAMPWQITEADRAARLDLRDRLIFSIDPPGCTDIDDALHVRPLPNGRVEVGVHIADVSHFVKEGTAIDKEAAARCTTVYLVNRRIDMLPELLSGNLCSLMSNVERFAFSVLWEMDPDSAEVLDVSYHKSIIRSRHSFTYAEAQARKDDPGRLPGADPVADALRLLNSLAQKLRARRMADGALTLASPEVKFIRDAETQDPVDVELYQQGETNSLVEEFMLLANVWTARRTYEAFPSFAILRRHPAPDPERFESLQAALRQRDLSLEPATSKQLQISLDRIAPDTPGADYLNKLVRILVTRCMFPAAYFASGTQPFAAFHHYGLAAPIYTHFTSPIRRYADIIVHRLLAAAIGVAPLPNLDKNKVARIADVINHRHRMAQISARSCVELYTVLFFKDKVQEEDSYITRLRANGFMVLVPRFGIEGAIYVDDSVSEHNEKEQSLRPRPGAPLLRVFDQVRVQISVVTLPGSHKPQLHFACPALGPPPAAAARASSAPSDFLKRKLAQPAAAVAPSLPAPASNQSKVDTPKRLKP